MNFSEFCESMQDPLYEKKGDNPKCEAGYTWNEKLGKCVPERNKNHAGENPGQRYLPNPVGGFDVFGSTGIDGDGYAMEEQADHMKDAPSIKDAKPKKKTKVKYDPDMKVFAPSIKETIMYHKTSRDYKRMADADKKHKEADDRMKYGKSGKEPETKLRRGEVRKFNKETGKYESNK